MICPCSNCQYIRRFSDIQHPKIGTRDWRMNFGVEIMKTEVSLKKCHGNAERNWRNWGSSLESGKSEDSANWGVSMIGKVKRPLPTYQNRSGTCSEYSLAILESSKTIEMARHCKQSWEVQGIPLLENKKVSWCLVSWFWVSWFLGFRVSKIYQISISCIFIEVDHISIIFKILFNGSSSFVGAGLFENREHGVF